MTSSVLDWRDKQSCRLDGYIVLITGASAGIGKETARDLAQRGATVILGCRDLEKTGNVVESILKEDSSIPRESFQIKRLDLGDNSSVKTFADGVKKEFPVIDILINNAGKMAGPRAESKDGFESQLATNHLGHFLLTHLLIDNVLASKHKPRIINLSSAAHKHGTINFDDIQLTKSYSGWVAYRQSKLANILFTKSLAEKYTSKINTYAVHPGIVKTELVRNSVLAGWLWYIGSWFIKNEAQGAQTTIYCAVSAEASDETGLYYADCEVSEPKEQATDMEVASKLWKVSCELLGISWD